MPAQEPGQPDPVGAGPFHSERLQPPSRTDALLAERQQMTEPGGRFRQVELGEAAAETVEQYRDVLVLVGVDTDDDTSSGRSCMLGMAGSPPWAVPGRWPAGRAGGQDCNETLIESGSYQVTARPTSGRNIAATRADRSTRRHPQGRS